MGKDIFERILLLSCYLNMPGLFSKFFGLIEIVVADCFPKEEINAQWGSEEEYIKLFDEIR